ncbi:MAG: hypothetical protein AB1758_31755 [Candidatus Eremiobacterota bacterium]
MSGTDTQRERKPMAPTVAGLPVEPPVHAPEDLVTFSVATNVRVRMRKRGHEEAAGNSGISCPNVSGNCNGSAFAPED